MSRSTGLRFAPLFVSVALAVAAPCPVFAAADPEIQKMLDSLEQQNALIKAQQDALSVQRAQLDAQEKEIAEHRKQLAELSTKIETGHKTSIASIPDLTGEQQTALSAFATTTPEELQASVGAGSKPAAEKTKTAAKDSKTEKATAPAQQQTATASPLTAPAKEETRPEIAALADSGGVLTPKGVLMYENSLEYINTTNNVFTFNGVQVAEVVFIGSPSSSTAKRQVVQDSNRFRLGITDRLEADVRIPYVYRSDTTTDTTGSTTTRTSLDGSGLGDLDMGVSYQINEAKEGWPYLVANARYKSPTGEGPYDVPYDSSNVATRLPTGTGFHSFEASMTAIKVSDPAVLFANLGYVYNKSSEINKTFDTTRILEVDPGDAINMSAGMGFSINPQTSFTLGYKHSYVFETNQREQNVSTLAITDSDSDTSSIGAFIAGVGYRFSPIVSTNFNVEIGATREAPDVRVGIRVPIRLGTVF